MTTKRARHLRAAAPVLALVLGALGFAPTSASAAPAYGPSKEARAAGINAAGEAFAGWSAGAKATGGPANTTSREALATVVPTGVKGMDVSSHQGDVNWTYWWGQGKRFAYVKATEGTGYTNPYFAQQYNGSYKVGMIRGSYHFALPNRSGGTTQADYFIDHGGGWSADGKTLPGALDIEYNPYGSTCYGLSQSSMRSWISAFSSRYKARTGRYPVIYTTTDWWKTCTGNTSAFAATSPLWIARYNGSSTPGELPAGWRYDSFWQYTSSPIDLNRWNGDQAGLVRMARGY